MKSGNKSSEYDQSIVVTIAIAVAILSEVVAAFMGTTTGLNLDVAIASLGIPTFGYSISRGLAKMQGGTTVISPQLTEASPEDQPDQPRSKPRPPGAPDGPEAY
tara:strand:- start:6866 stop:7177 length:312 start_codon:yes stop_codon:yes gene_type:complete